MTKIYRAFVILLTATVLLFLCVAPTVAVYAETEEDIETTETVSLETEDSNTIDDIATQFISYLKEKYGEDYTYYYNIIIEKWGSIEGYLLDFGNKLPEEQQSGWDKFVGWLQEYAVIWAPILAVIALIVAIIFGKKIYKKIKDWFTLLVEKLVNKKLAPIENELNLQSKAMAATLHSLKALLGSSEKFAENVKELDEADKELTDG